MTQRIQVIDSHTGGEPTRVVLEGSIPFEGETMADRLADFRTRFDHLRSGIVNEPRGSSVLVGAALTAPVSPNSEAGILFFNDVTYLGMCGHGTMGVVETLRHLGRIETGTVFFDTPAGQISAELREDGSVAVANVKSYRFLDKVSLEVPGLGRVVGDVAYGGNWFFIVHEPSFDIDMSHTPELADACARIRAALKRDGISGKDGAEINHVELAGTSLTAQSRNYVMCPGGAYDRSPCGTGTSAKLACLYAEGELAADEEYVQESVTGSCFTGRVSPVEGGVMPTIVGRAYVTAESTLIFRNEDPIRWGLVP